MLEVHAEVVESLREWLEDVAGLGGVPARGSRVVVVAHDPGFGMDVVLRGLFADLADRYDPDGFWQPELTGPGLAATVADPDGWPGFVWLGVSASTSGAGLRDLAEQLSGLGDVLAIEREGWRRAGFDTQSTVAGAASLAAGLLAAAVGDPRLGAAVGVGVFSALSQAVGVGSWAVDLRARARFNRESVLANVADSHDVVTQAVRRLVEVTNDAGLPVVIVADNAHIPDPLIDALVGAMATAPQGQTLLVVTGDRDPDQPGIAGELGQRLRSPGLVAPLNPERIMADPAPPVDRRLIAAQLEHLDGRLGPDEIAGLVGEVTDLGVLARWATQRSGDPATDRVLLARLAASDMQTGGWGPAGVQVWQMAEHLGLVCSRAGGPGRLGLQRYRRAGRTGGGRPYRRWVVASRGRDRAALARSCPVGGAARRFGAG